MSKIHFSCNIIIFDSYQLSVNPPLIKNQKDNIQSKTQIKKVNNDLIMESKNKINFYTENKINLYNAFMNRDISYFPIIRIFGSTKSGQKCCVNIHKYFPYFYIGITKENYFNYNSQESLRAFAISLENTFIEYRTEIGRKSLFQVDNKENEKENDNNNLNLKEPEQVIHNITLVYKTNIYGYYNTESVFLKVECYNPGDIKDLMFILSQNGVNNNFYQCYDAHISYSTHFFGDFNLYGMGNIYLKNFSVRGTLPDNYYEIDYKKNFTIFQKNIKWDNKEKENNEINFDINNNYNNNEIPKEEIIKFIDKYNDFMIWDKKYIDFMNLNIKYNNFNKSSSSLLEIDCTIDDIIMENINTNEENEDLLNDNDVNKEVNISNLKLHIKHCTSLIDLWKEEIRRRKNSNLPPLKFEKISDQKVFTLTEDFFIKKKEESEFLLKLNYEINNTEINLDELQFLLMEENYINTNENNDESNENKNNIKQMIDAKLNYRNKYIEQYYGHSYEWYKDHYNKSLFQNIYEIITEHVNNNDDQEDQIIQNSDEEYKKIKEDYEFDLSCFDSERTLNELSINTSTRNLYKGILSNKTIDELTMNTPNKKKNEFNLGESSIKKLFFSEEKEGDKISKGKYLLIADSAMKKIIKMNSTNKKETQENNKIEENVEDINTLFYSDYDDYKKFYKLPMRLNPRFNAFKGNSLELMVNNHNKIIFKENKDKFKQINSELILNEEKNMVNNVDINKYDKIFFGKFYNKFNEKSNNENLLLSNDKNVYNLIYEKYDIEISPITEKKFVPSYKLNSKFKSPKSKKDLDDINFSNFISSSIFGSAISANNEGNKLSKKYEKYYEDSNNMTILSVEILADSKSNLAFNYLTDSILCIFFSFYDDNFITTEINTKFSLISVLFLYIF